MIQFTKLRINGFKSFVERSELEIASGLNGVVGPNGCGKSNLVEALRWVMGESSAKRMRGGGMEDVIFNGTDKRAQRNIAEVSLLLDNSMRTAPSAYNNSDEIEITRKIERDRGSAYKINGKNVRARDVQMLFADTVTGANSPAMVSQGRITQIINTKPLERRLILEESAGISGLFARRHEAELRLRAADKNLMRLEDILGSMEGRLSALKRQMRQASRYKNISAQIRQLELLIAHMEWSAIEERASTTRKAFESQESLVAKKLAVVTQLTKTQNVQMEDIPPLRNKEAEAAAALQIQKLALQRLEDETARLEHMLKENTTQLKQNKIDEVHESQTLLECVSTLEKLESEQKVLIKIQKNEKEQSEKKEALRDELEQKVLELEARYTALMQSEAESKAHKESLELQIQQNSERLDIVEGRKVRALQELTTFENEENFENKIKESSNNIIELEAFSEKLNKDMQIFKDKQKALHEDLQGTRDTLSKVQAKCSEFYAEINMLESFFSDFEDGDYSPVLESITTETGFEKALSRALGDGLLASVEESAPTRWINRNDLIAMPDLPNGAQPLRPHVSAPKELQLALSQIGVVENEEQGDELTKTLLPGQSLVSLSGTYWRWDGYSVRAEAADQNALRLEQKNKLLNLQRQKPAIERNVKLAEDALSQNIKKDKELTEKIQENDSKAREVGNKLTIARQELSHMREKQARIESQSQHLGESLKMAEEDIRTLSEVITWDKKRLQTCEEATSAQQKEDTESLRTTLLEARAMHQEAIRSFDQYQQEQSKRTARLHAIADERINMQNRQIRARERLKDFQNRQALLKEKLKEIQDRPKQCEADKSDLLFKISTLEKQRNKAAETLAIREGEVEETRKALKEAEGMLGTAREERAHAQATLTALQEQRATLQESIQEQFEISPQDLKSHLTLPSEHSVGTLDSSRKQKEKLMRDRDSIGPVNLRAEDEALELEKEVTTLLHERNDLMQAIEELRGGINKINKEARQRLLLAFDHVNAHFQQLFTRLFGGGQAHLALIDSPEGSNDPLGAGLEIFAQPPGKTLQSLSLLSGGEQTMASIALIFAMFLTNPSPICVLDEIDAPLDDANVDRVCDLLEEISERGETRFLIITHHRLTMARMDRLYGVTMSERGVSQLVSVDLQQSFEFLDEAA